MVCLSSHVAILSRLLDYIGLKWNTIFSSILYTKFWSGLPLDLIIWISTEKYIYIYIYIYIQNLVAIIEIFINNLSSVYEKLQTQSSWFVFICSEEAQINKYFYNNNL